jgi:hypothetical protein
LGLGEILSTLGSSLGGFLKDPQSYRDMAGNVPDAARGLLAQAAGWPVDMSAMALRAAGVRLPQDSKVVGSTDWVGGKLGANVQGMPYKIASMLPTDATDVAKLGGSVAPGLAALLFHGSPHKFDKFDMSKIGTGEGAQAYGHGLYFADTPGVAASYRDGNSMQLGIDRANWHFNKITKPEIDVPFPEPKGGNLYKVDVPDDAIAKMLDWDKPLSKQNDHVKAALQKINHPAVKEALERDWQPRKLVETLEDTLGVEKQARGYPQGVTRRVGGESETSRILREAGIPGTQYLDAMSRGAGSGTRNYVLFDDSLARIVGRE